MSEQLKTLPFTAEDLLKEVEVKQVCEIFEAGKCSNVSDICPDLPQCAHCRFAADDHEAIRGLIGAKQIDTRSIGGIGTILTAKNGVIFQHYGDGHGMVTFKRRV